MLLPILFLPSSLVERLSSPYVETTLTFHGEGVISYLASYSYRPACVHLLGSDWVSGLVLSDDEALCLYGGVTLYPS